MANALYARGREGYLGGDLAWDSNDVRVLLIDEADETVDLANDQDLADVTGAGIVATSSSLGSKTITNGVADSADFTFLAVTGDQSESLSAYYHTGTPSTSILIANVDTATGLPVTPNSGDISVTIHSSGWFTL